MPHPLFVYGTLRKDYAASLPTLQRGHRVTPYDSLLKAYARFHSNAKVPGLLYNFGKYPGLIPSDDLSHFVIGELHHITNEDALWPSLDDYEGCSPTSETPHLFTRQLPPPPSTTAPNTPAGPTTTATLSLPPPASSRPEIISDPSPPGRRWQRFADG